jgi:anti-anti-sigma factor
MISVSTCGSALLLSVAGDVDACDAVALRNAIAEALEDATACHVVVDVTRATRLSWRSLAVLADAQASLARDGGELHMVIAEGTVVSETGDLGRLFHLHGSVEEALAASAQS